MKKLFMILSIILLSFTSKATIHVVLVWDGYFSFVDADITIQLGDTVQWLPLDSPSMVHTITSTNIPTGAEAFDQIWQAPIDTFFQYVPTIVGLYEYECTPHAVDYGMIGSINVVDGTTSINENGIREKDRLVYPNPTSGFLTIQNLPNSNFQIDLYDFRGVLVRRFTSQDITNQQIDIGDIENGLYLLGIKDGSENSVIHKIIKN